MYLNCHSYFSLKYGTIPPKELLEMMEVEKVTSFALTDINNTSAALELLRISANNNIHISLGIDFRIGAQQQFIGIAKNNKGFKDLNSFLSFHSKHKESIPRLAPVFNDAFVIYPFGSIEPHELEQGQYVGVNKNDLTRLLFSVWKEHLDKLVILQPITMRNKREFNAHRILRAIDCNVLLSQLPKTEEARADDVFMSENQLKEAFNEYPQLIENTTRLLSQTSIHFEFNDDTQHKNLKAYTGNGDLDFRLMKKLCYEGLTYRYDKVGDEILDRIAKELAVIKEKGFVAYFLIAWKILKYARTRNYFYVGRGSGANSIVAYLMRITDVDPIELDLYFERFINLYRKSPPDFDIDFSWKEREDVTQYIFNRFENVSLLGAYSTFKHKSVIREIAKTFGIPAHEIKNLQYNIARPDSHGKLVLQYANVIRGFPSHITVHSAGIVIAEEPIQNYTATFMPPKGFPTTHFDMHTAEDVGLYKFDILGQRGLAKVKDALQLVRDNHPGARIDIHNMKLMQRDLAANNLLKTGTAIGCFYVESPAMRMLLRKLEVSNYLELVAASSVIRPGVAQSGMMSEYIERHRNVKHREEAKKKYPVLFELMPDTYGVMVYQEDVIKVAHYFAGLTLSEADVLRRGMSGKYRSRAEFKEVKDKFFSNCKGKEILDNIVHEIWLQIESFAGYAFAKGHSASYAVESYQCLYLKAYYPIEFMVATINNGGGFYSAELYFHEVKKYGAIVHSPCINTSAYEVTLYDKDVYVGFNRISGLEIETIKRILLSRQHFGLFESMRDFVTRVAISIEQLMLLIRVGAFSFTNQHKKALLWDAHFLLSSTKNKNTEITLFNEQPKTFYLPELWQHELEDLFDEIELLGFSLHHSPFDLAVALPDIEFTVSKFKEFVNKKITMVGYMVHVKNTQTKLGDRMHFGTFLDIKGEWIDTVVFPYVVQRYPFTGPGCYIMHGIVVEEFGYISLQIIWQKRIPSKNMDDGSSTRLKLPNNYNKVS